MRVVLLIVLVCAADAVRGEHHCGIGTISRTCSLILSTGCDSELLSGECCFNHDRCYDNITSLDQLRFARYQLEQGCDLEFKTCINALYDGRWYCQNVIHLTHGIVAGLRTSVCNTFGFFCCDQ